MKFRLLALALMAFAASAFAQSAPFKEVIHLKNGSVLKGLITEWVPGSSLTIQLADSSIFVCPMSDVAKVSREFTPVASKASKVVTTPVIPQDYEFFASVGYGINSGKYGLDVVNFNMVYGKNLTASHFVGAGTGLRYFLTDNEFAMLPLFAEYRYRMDRGSIAPYGRIALGYSLNTQGIEKSGVLFNPRIGVEFPAGSAKVCFDMGYQTQQMPFLLLDNWTLVERYKNSEALCFNLGLVF
jgi:hypothetical protein